MRTTDDEDLDRMRADAARYRFLRDVSTFTWHSLQEQWRMPRDQCDAAIDKERNLYEI